jgi:hypothetical protein
LDPRNGEEVVGRAAFCLNSSATMPNSGFAKEVATGVFEKLSEVKKVVHMAFCRRKFGERYSAAPNGISPAAARRSDEEDSEAGPPTQSVRSAVAAATNAAGAGFKLLDSPV